MISILDMLHRGAFRTSRDGDQKTGEIWIKIGIRENGTLGTDAADGE